MSRQSRLARGVALLGAAIFIASCSSVDAIAPSGTSTTGIFKSYVAIGNSITAGYQSGGINDSTQRQSYAVLLAAKMGTRFNYPSLNGGDGCRPTVNFQTGAQTTNPPVGTPCLRNTFSVSDILNSVAVPGAASVDPTSTSTPNSNALTTLILSGRTQVQAALAANPTFVSIWIGNNDVLPYAVGGIPIAATPESTFEKNYNTMLTQLYGPNPTLKGVLIGVVNVANAPVLFTSAALLNPQFLGGLSLAAGKPITFDNTCTGTDGSLISLQIVTDIAKNGRSTVISCTGDSPLQQDDILTLAEQAQIGTIVSGYNAFIKARANALGWAFYDPNVTLAAQKALGLIPAFPNLASATAPFGTLFTLDGVHPSAAGHILIVNDLIDQINAMYKTTLAHAP